MSWRDRAWGLAARVADHRSRWHEAVLSVPRHELVPRWFARDSGSQRWELRDGPSDERAWLDASYDPGRALVTRVGAAHADLAAPGAVLEGEAASQAAGPGLVIAMFRLARIYPGCDVLEAGTGSGYGAALLARRFGDQHVTSIDADRYAVTAATGRLGSFGARPLIVARDPAAGLPGGYDRIVAMVSLPGVPPSWLEALRPGGRLVFCLAGGPVLITADKTADGGARGRVEYEPAAFPPARQQAGPPLRQLPGAALRGEDHLTATRSSYPVVDPAWGGELDALLSVTAPGTASGSSTDPQTGITTTWLGHRDGSWARAAGRPGEPARVHQSGPRRLWDLLDEHRSYWLASGCLPLRGAQARIDPDGTCHLTSGPWHAVIPACGQPGR